MSPLPLLALLLGCAPPAKPLDTARTDSADTDSADTAPADIDSADTAPTDTDSTDTAPADTHSVDTSPTDTGPPADSDGDGTPDPDDCAPDDPAVHPGAREDCATATDDDCDGDTNDAGALGCTDFPTDADHDSYGSDLSHCLCTVDADHAAATGDCDDADPAVHPGAEDVCADGVDADCSGDDACVIDGFGRAMEGDRAGVYAGWQVEGALDVDGDGAPDLVTTAPYASGGEAYVYAGPVAADMAPPLTLAADADGKYLGTLLTVADLNADGVGDVVLGAPWDTTVNSGSGAFHVLPGPVRGGVVTEVGATVYGSSGFLAWGITAGDDLDGDGEADILAYNVGQDSYLGFAGSVADGSTEADATFAIELGRRPSVNTPGLGRMGDLDGDGFADLVVSADYTTGDGEFAVRYGPVVGFVAYGDSDVLVAASVGGEHLGGEVAPIADADGDGLPDFIVASEVATYLFVGGAVGAVTSADAAATFPDLGMLTGAGTAASPDLDGDGTPELALGSNAAGGSYEGVVAAWAAPFAGTLGLAEALGSFYGSVPSHGVGIDTAAAGDLDGDGRGELLVGATGDPTAGLGAGAVYLLPGAAW